MMRTYDNYAKAASDRTSEINGAKREVKTQILDFINNGGTMDQLKAMLQQ
jgi:hypothetical protein